MARLMAYGKPWMILIGMDYHEFQLHIYSEWRIMTRRLE